LWPEGRLAVLQIFFITNHNVPYQMDDSRKDVRPKKGQKSGNEENYYVDFS